MGDEFSGGSYDDDDDDDYDQAGIVPDGGDSAQNADNRAVSSSLLCDNRYVRPFSHPDLVILLSESHKVPKYTLLFVFNINIA